MSKSKAISKRKVLISIVIVAGVVLAVVGGVYKMNKANEVRKTQTVAKVSPTISPINIPSKANTKSDNTTEPTPELTYASKANYNNNLVSQLPNTFQFPEVTGFEFKYPNGWAIEATTSADPITRKLSTNNDYTCSSNCLGVRVFNTNVSLLLTIVFIYGNEGMDCYENTVSTSLDENWIRINKNTYVPKRNIAFKSNVNSHQTSVCKLGSGIVLNDRSYVKKTIPTSQAVLLLEFPGVMGNPSQEETAEIDLIVKSIKGLRQN